MRANTGQRYPFAFLLVSAVACATATEEDIPPAQQPDDVGNTGGTGNDGTGGTAPGTGGSAANGGSTSVGSGGSTSAGGSKSNGSGGGKATGGTGFGSGGSTGSGGSKSGGFAGFGFPPATGGTASGGSTGTPSPAACPNPIEPATPGAVQGDSGSFGTLEAVCYFVEGNFNSWNCSNLGGRTIAVNGTPVLMCGGPLPAKVDGGYYFEFGASTSIEYTSFYWYTS